MCGPVGLVNLSVAPALLLRSACAASTASPLSCALHLVLLIFLISQGRSAVVPTVAPPSSVPASATKTIAATWRRAMNRLVHALLSAAKGSMWASWTVTNAANTRLVEGSTHGSFHRRGGLAVAGGELLPARRLLREVMTLRT